ncbi:MAG: sulfotransferase domain-containing protein [Pseudomonadota bacterium]
MSHIVWLASYPKSGNTWLRAFLANYISDAGTPVDINRLPEFSLSDNHARYYELIGGKPAAKMSPGEIHRLRPAVHRLMAGSRPGRVFVKTHNAIATLDGIPTITAQATAGAIYVIRNPFDTVVSFADHYGLTLDAAIKAINSDANTTLPAAGVIFEFLASWGQHVRSWTTAKGLRLTVIRYEDLAARPTAAFGAVVRFLDLPADAGRLERAIRFSAFEVLAGQERKGGFIEGSGKADRFFRQGKVGAWREVLSEAQVARILERHREVMTAHGYLTRDGQVVA